MKMVGPTGRSGDLRDRCKIDAHARLRFTTCVEVCYSLCLNRNPPGNRGDSGHSVPWGVGSWPCTPRSTLTRGGLMPPR